jgi:endoglucanase
MSFELTRRAIVGGGLATSISAARSRHLCAAFEGNGLAFAGVNLCGAEFGTIPGAPGVDYTFPAPAVIDYFVELGFNLIRVPFSWERLQPALYAPFAGRYLAQLSSLVEYAARRKLRIVLDTHNFARRRVIEDGWSVDHLIGSELVPASAFADYCQRLAIAFKANPSIIFGLMNEPWGLEAEDWLAIVNQAIAAIRREGANQLILIPGVAYTGAHSWVTAGNVVMGNATDPANNIAFEVHQYFDEDSSGTSPKAVGPRIGSERIEEFQRWARYSGVRAFLGEVGAGDNDIALEALSDICQTVQANSDVWIGWAAWAGGGTWPADYIFGLDPLKNGQIRPHTKVLARYAQSIRAQSRKI